MQIRHSAPLLNVHDMELSLEFYCGFLGFSVYEDYELDGDVLWAAIYSGEARLMLSMQDKDGSAERNKRENYADLVLYLYVDDATEAHRELSAKGLAPTEIEQEDVGLKEFYLRDPDGYEIGISSPVPPWAHPPDHPIQEEGLEDVE
jgi:catechol 2,3-dioxygenase-like lactoylglutathione lyase family enzyme